MTHILKKMLFLFPGNQSLTASPSAATFSAATTTGARRTGAGDAAGGSATEEEDAGEDANNADKWILKHRIRIGPNVLLRNKKQSSIYCKNPGKMRSSHFMKIFFPCNIYFKKRKHFGSPVHLHNWEFPAKYACKKICLLYARKKNF